MESRPHRRVETTLLAKTDGSGNGSSISASSKKLAETTLLLEVLAQVNSLMSKGKSFESFCIEVAQILSDKFSFKMIHIWIRDEKDEATLKLVTPGTVGGFRTSPIQRGIVGKAIRESRTICLPDVGLDPDYVNVFPDTKSELCVPLISENETIGAINIETGKYETFESQRAIIEIIAENLSHSLKMALLYRTEERFHRLVEQMSEGVWVGNAQEHTIYTNPSLQKMIGFTEAELLTKLSYDMFDEKSKRQVLEENKKRQLGLGGHYEAFFISKNGERIPVIIHAIPFGSGGTMATITDLRGIKSTEKKLAQAERFLASITQYCPEAIIGLDENGIIQSWNRGAEKLFGYKNEEVSGKSNQLIIPDERIASGEPQQIIQEAKMKGFVKNFETVRLHKNGKPLMVSLTLSSLKDDEDKIVGLSAFYRDITAQKKWERELQDRFEKMQEAYREMGKQRRYLDYLIEIIMMTTSSDVQKKHVATFSVNALIMITKVNAVTMRFLDPPSGKLMLVAQSGLGEEWWSKKAIPYSGSLLESAVAHGQPLKIFDILSDSRYTSAGLARKNNLRSALIIPLEAKGEVIGSLTLYLSHENNLSLLDDEFITIFSKQVAIALKFAS